MKEKKIGKKKVILLVIVILFIIFICFFIKNVYKNKKVGNNMSNKNIEEIEEYILNISSYEATMEITTESNKNTNKYRMKQIYQKDKISKQIVLEPSNVEGIEIEYQNNILTIKNAKINLETVYKDYNNLVDNLLWIDAFIKDYVEAKSKNQASIIEENGAVIMETITRNQNNQYVYKKKLYIDRNTGKPIKLFVQDINKKNLVYILYNEITINGLQ